MDSINHKTFKVKFNKEFTIKPTDASPESSPTLTLSNLDLLSGRFPVTYFYFYTKQQRTHDFGSITESLRNSLAGTLNYFYPFAGEITHDPETNEPVIICNNRGAFLVKAQADIELKDLNFHNLDEIIESGLVCVNPDYPFQVQVTEFICGGVSLTFTFDHALGDASSFGKFLTSWSEVSRFKPVSCVPDHSRNLRPRFPPRYHPLLDQTYIKCNTEEIKNIPTTKTLIKRLYHIDASSIKALQDLTSVEGTKKTKIEAFSAYVWKKLVDGIDRSCENCKMGWLVDGRGRYKTSMGNYIGNVLSVAFGEASVAELKKSSLSEIADNVHKAIVEVANQTHFEDLIDWIEVHRPGLMLSRVVLGQEGVETVVVSSGRRFPVAELDFGFGSPMLGTVCSTIEKIGVGYLNQRPSAKADGSWIVSAIVWPELAAALESDSIFQPMSANYLPLQK